MPKPFSYEKFKEIYSQVPRLCVDLIIKQKDKYLLTLRTKDGYVNRWHLPGGTVYYHESIEQAAKRLAKEEVGLEIEIEKCLGYLEFPDEMAEKGFGHSVSVALLCRPMTSDISLDDHAEKAEFFARPPANTVSVHKILLEKLA